jgi:hypothetical protein
MSKKKKFLLFFMTVFLCMVAISGLVLLQNRKFAEATIGEVAGAVSPLVSFQNTSDAFERPAATAAPLIITATPVAPTAKVNANSISFQDSSASITEGEYASFTWSVNGAPKTIHKTGIYFGKTSAPEPFALTMAPMETPYTMVVKDFLNGNYDVPLRFIGSIPVTEPGTYYAKAYALIDGEHYWSGERTFTVTAIPRHTIKVIDPPKTAAKGTNIPFTWEVSGPGTTTGYTTIAIGRLSKPGDLDGTVSMSQTPYAMLVKDFTGGTYSIPLRFIGNAVITEPGDYFYRALVFVGGKNIWSEEYPLKVE